MLNQVQIIGHLGADVESKSFQNGGKVCNFRVAVTEKWKKDGEQRERTEWVSVAIFNEGLCGVAERFLRKGSKVFVQGKLATRKRQAQDGSDRYTTEVVLNGYDAKMVLLDGKPEGQRDDGLSHGNRDGFGGQGRFNDDLDDDLPPF